MVVFLPLLPGEATKSCSLCPHVGLISPITTRSSFVKRIKNADGFETFCRGCSAKKRAVYRDTNRERENEMARRRRARMSEEERERKRAYQREWCRKRTQTSPEFRRRRYERNLAYTQRLKERIGEEAYAELQRMKRLDYAWRHGTPIPTLEEVQEVNGYSGERWPLEPFLEWIRELSCWARVEDGLPDTGRTNAVHGRVAARLKIPERRIYAWLHDEPRGWIDSRTVERAAARHGEITPAQIYWFYGPKITLEGGIAIYHWDPQEHEPKVMRALSGGFEIRRWEPRFPGDEEVEVAPKAKVKAITERCRSPFGTPNCEGTAVEGARWCGPCGERLARVRADMEGRAHAFRKSIKKKGARPTCCNPGCQEPRLRGNRYCFLCQQEGWDEGDVE